MSDNRLFKFPHIDTFPKMYFPITEYKTTHLWSENGTDFRVYKKLDVSTSGNGGICLGFRSNSKKDSKNNLSVMKLDQNCHEEQRLQKRNVEYLSLTYEGKYFLREIILNAVL